MKHPNCNNCKNRAKCPTFNRSKIFQKNAQDCQDYQPEIKPQRKTQWEI